MVFPRSLQGAEMYQEGPGHDPATVSPVCPDLGLGALAACSDMLDPSSAAPKSWLMSLALASSRDVSFQTGQLVYSPRLDFSVHPTDASMAMSIATLSGPSSTGESAPETATAGVFWRAERRGKGQDFLLESCLIRPRTT